MNIQPFSVRTVVKITIVCLVRRFPLRYIALAQVATSGKQ
jgi:hypothetical protein